MLYIFTRQYTISNRLYRDEPIDSLAKMKKGIAMSENTLMPEAMRSNVTIFGLSLVKNAESVAECTKKID